MTGNGISIPGLHPEDHAFEHWLKNVLALRYDAYKANPSCAIPLEQLRKNLEERRRKRAGHSLLRNVLIALLFALVTPTLCIGQSRPSFEVASIRPSNAPVNEGNWSIPGTGRFNAHNLTLARLIALAYGVDDNQIANKPPWLELDRFDIAAKPFGNIPLSREELKPLLQSLLEERFHLAIHTETRLMPGYILTVAKGGPKLQPTKGSKFPGFRVNVNDKELNGLNWSMPYLATMLQHPAGRPVLDKTGLSGSYDLKLDFSPDPSADSVLPSIFTALQETLGLKLEPQKIPVEVLVIDHADRTPAEN